MNNNPVIHTALGDIIAEPSPDKCYPGIYLSLRRGDKTFGIVLLEVDQVNSDDLSLNAHVWNPEEIWEDPVFSMQSTKETVDKMFEGDAE